MDSDTLRIPSPKRRPLDGPPTVGTESIGMVEAPIVVVPMHPTLGDLDTFCQVVNVPNPESGHSRVEPYHRFHVRMFAHSRRVGQLMLPVNAVCVLLLDAISRGWD